jgi:TolB protein
MHRYSWILAIGLMAALTACNVLPGMGGAEQAATTQRLDPSAWPTPQPTPLPASPTPFPKITLAPTASPTPGASTAGVAGAASTTPSSPAELTFSGNPADLVGQVTQLSGGFPPVAAAAVKSAGTSVRQEPAEAAASLGTTQPGELAAVLGQNQAGDWLYVLTRSGLQGWLPANAVQVTFSLGPAPVLPPDPVAQKSSQPAATNAAPADPLGGLEPAAVALVIVQNAAMRQGPAASYAEVSQLAQGELAAVLGVNPDRNWLYIITISGTQGWVAREAMRITGSLVDARVLPANPLAASTAATTPASSSQPPASTASAGANQPLTLSDLQPVATARVNNPALNLRQGPGAAYEILDTLAQDDQVALLALNKSQDWALVKTAAGEYGWTSLEYLAVDGSLNQAPIVISPAPDRNLPPGQVVPAYPEVGNAGSSPLSAAPASSSSGTHTDQPAAQPVGLDLSPKTSARATGPDVKLYRGPSASDEPIVALSPDEPVSVLALDQAGKWALVRPDDTYKSPGWAPLEDLSIDGALSNAPQATTAWVDSNELAVRRGPGIFYDQIGTLAIHDLVAVLGVNQGREWALVQPVLGGGAGWIPLNFLTLTSSWADVPVASVTALPQPAPPSAQTASLSGNRSGPGRIVFQTASGGQIMAINPDGTGLQRLTQGIDPVLSPDGQTVAFTRWAGDTGTLWLIGVDGSNERAVLGETKQAKHPAWSPDGRQIVVNFQHEGRLHPKQICENMKNLHGQTPNLPWNVVPGSVKVDMKDDGPYLCWTLPPDPHWGLRVVNLADGSYQDLPSDTYAYGPDWDPANLWRVASSGLNGLVQVDVNRQVDWALTDSGDDHTPTFSPDGRYIAVAFNNNGQYDVYRLNSDGSGRMALTKTPLWVAAQPGTQKPWNNVSPAWSPDGSRIAFLTDRTGRWEIWVMNADGSNQHAMFSQAINDQLQFSVDFVDERMLSWR